VKIRLVTSICSMLKDGWADRQTDSKQLTVTCHNYGKAPNNLTEGTAINPPGTSRYLHIKKKHNSATLQPYS
jgi:hypothetical protein